MVLPICFMTIKFSGLLPLNKFADSKKICITKRYHKVKFHKRPLTSAEEPAIHINIILPFQHERRIRHISKTTQFEYQLRSVIQQENVCSL